MSKRELQNHEQVTSDLISGTLEFPTRPLRKAAPKERSGKSQQSDERNIRGIRRSLPRAAAESLSAGFSLYAGFILQSKVIANIGSRPFVGQMELILICLGLASSYAFVYVLRRQYQMKPASLKMSIFPLLGNITGAYILQLGLLFLIKDENFALDKAAIAFGFAAGYMMLILQRLIEISKRRPSGGREGRKSLVLKSKGSGPDQSGGLRAQQRNSSDRIEVSNDKLATELESKRQLSR